jgi:hypothetical protein
MIGGRFGQRLFIVKYFQHGSTPHQEMNAVGIIQAF